MTPALLVEGLAVEFQGAVRALRGVSLEIPAGKTLAIVGESGSGKTTLALALLGLLPSSAKISGKAMLAPQGAPSRNEDSSPLAPQGAPRRKEDSSLLAAQGAPSRKEDSSPLDGVDLLGLDPRGEEMRRVRGKKIGMIFQEPATALSPVYTVGEQIAESLRLHRGMNRADAWAGAIAALARVGIADPERRVSEYPHELSGGMRQRVMIAIALAGEPAILLADEPTASLDVTVQAAVLKLMRTLQAERKTSLVLITHDLGVVAEMADDVVVMKEGLIVERGPVDAIFHAPQHEYTRELLEAAVLR